MKVLIKIVAVAVAAAFVFAEEATTPHFVGGKTEVGNDDHNVTDLLNANLVRLATGDKGGLELISIKNITKQVVAGMKYEITGVFRRGNETNDCMVTLWCRSWLDDENERVKLRASCGKETILAKNDTEVW